EATYNITLQYYDGSGKQIASSRTTPVENYPFKTGQWRISDLYGIYGREVEMLCLLDPHKLHLTEDDYTRLGVNWEGRGDDAARYAEWMRQGKVAPAINVAETDSGVRLVVEGHRRVAAAKMAGVKLLAWVSFVMRTGKRDCNDRELWTGLTFEGAKFGPVRAYHMWQERSQQRTIDVATVERAAACEYSTR